ncbi:MAG: nucleoside deaminase [Acidimicrobiia bacterium]|nr:nucleoside deaminase [Acidimicrobiia bacterium]
MSSNPYLDIAISQAKMGRDEGGVPIGSVLVVGERIAGRGRNQRVQQNSATLHAEMHALESAGRLTAEDYANSIMVSTLSPCDMCSGAVLLYGIPEVIVGENRTFQGPEEYLRSRGVKVTVVDDKDCVTLMEDFIRRNPELWNEDIGV